MISTENANSNNRIPLSNRCAIILPKSGLVQLLAWSVILCLMILFANPIQAQTGGLSLRFYGHGVTAPDQDRVKIRVDDPANTNPGPPVDVGATDFTLEFWMKANSTNNPAPTITCGANFDWIYGNIVFDRDRFSQDRTFGLSLGGGRWVLGVIGQGGGVLTVCGTTNVLNDQWHHVAVQRRRSDGWLWLYVDGVLDGQANGPDGDISYPDDGVPGNYCNGPCTNSDPFLVIGAEKHDAGSQYPSYIGLIDEVRVSNILRYNANFTRPSAPFTTDANTVALYHFDEGPAGACTGTILDSSGAIGGPSNGECKYGGSAPAGPVYTTDTPFSGASPTNTFTPTSTATNTPTGTLTNTPTNTPTATNTPTTTPGPPPPPPNNPIYLPFIFKSAWLILFFVGAGALGTLYMFFRRAAR